MFSGPIVAFDDPVIVGEWDITIREASATPLPAALPLFATGLGALGLLARRRKRKAVVLAGIALTAICLTFGVPTAKADTLTTFDVTGSFASPVTSLTGTLTFDTTLAT